MGAEHRRRGCGAVAAMFMWHLIWSLAWTLLLSLLCARHRSRKVVGSWSEESYMLLACQYMLYFLLFPTMFWGIFFCSAWDPICNSCFEGCLHSPVCLSCTLNVWYYFCKTGIPSKHKCSLRTNKIAISTQVWLCFFIWHCSIPYLLPKEHILK